MSGKDDFEAEDKQRCDDLRQAAEDLRLLRYYERKLNGPIADEEEIDYLFTQEEMCDEIPGYKSLLGRGRKLPLPLKTVDLMARYLRCNPHQHNTLRLAAGYAPVDLDPTGDKLEAVLRPMRETLHYLPFPGYIVSRTWIIQEVNTHLLTFLGLQKADAQKILQSRPSVLNFIFDPQLGMRQRLDCIPGEWKSTAQRNIYGFKLVNLLTQQDEEYQRVVNQLKSLPPEYGFTSLWDQVRIDRMQLSPFLEADYITRIKLPGDEAIVSFRSLHIHHGDLVYPSIIAYFPVDKASRDAFARLGLPVPESNW